MMLKPVTRMQRLLPRNRVSLSKQADIARDEHRYAEAAALYERAIQAGDGRVGLHVQAAHMYKEARNIADAERHYTKALDRLPNDADLQLQLGHFYKLVGQYKKAFDFYQRALALRPDWLVAQKESAELKRQRELRQEMERGHIENAADLLDPQAIEAADSRFIAPDLFPAAPENLTISHQDAFVPTRFGNRQITEWGDGLTLRGLDALRGYFVSSVPVHYVEIFLDGQLIYKQDLVPAIQRREKTNRDIKKYVYNAWIDFARFDLGWHDLLIRSVNARGDARPGIDWRRERVIIAEQQSPAFWTSAASVPPLDPHSTLSLEEQINARPSLVHRAGTNSFPGTVDNILVIRVDQLGDMVISVPALRRLREVFPQARIVGLFTRANADLARTLGIFDECLVVDFPDDEAHQRRVMTRTQQEELRDRLAPYKFDLAIDFPVSGVSYRLLPLTGAPVTLGFCGSEKTMDLSLSPHDPKTNDSMMRHSARTRMLVETLAAFQDSGARVLRREDLSRSLLKEYGIEEAQKFAVVHAGSRIKFTRWRHFPELAAEIVKVGVQVVFIADDDTMRDRFDPDAIASGKIVYMARQLPFDHFDAMVSFCSVFVGNDSGPKHLAALRGANVVSIHPGRSSWSEWGQEQTGVVIMRQLPCGGCGINHYEPEECGRDAACVKYITLDEVFGEVRRFLEAA